MSSLFQTIDKTEPVYDKTYGPVLFLCKMLLTMDILITCMAVAGRCIPFVPDSAWSEEVVLTCMVYTVVLSAAPATRRNAHVRVAAFGIYLPKTVVRALDILSNTAVLALAVITITVGWKYANGIGSKGTYVSMPWLSRLWIYFPVPSAGVAMVIFELEVLYNHIKAIRMGEEE